MKKISILLITIITLIIWRPIASQVPMGEGYYYFEKCQMQLTPSEDCASSLKQFDNLARISFKVMTGFFKDDLGMYMYSQIATMLLLYITFYLVLLKVTKNNAFALFTTIFFLSNHTGSFSMMATGNYQRFAQRVPNLIPMLISFSFFVKYMDKKRIVDLILFYLLFVGSLFLAHHGIFLLPLFIVYALVKTFSQKLTTKTIITPAMLILSIIVIAKIITGADHFVPKQNLFEFTTSTPHIFEKTVLQIPNLIIPSGITKFIATELVSPPLPYPFTNILRFWAIILAPLFLFTIYSLKNKSDIALLFRTAVFALPIVSLLNLYAYGDGTPDPLRNFGEDRIYFVSSIFSSLIVGTYSYLAWTGGKMISKIIVATILILYVTYNAILIGIGSNNIKPNSTKMETFITYTRANIANPNFKIAIIGPSHLLWPELFLSNFYNTNDNLLFILDSTDWLKSLDLNHWNKIVIVDYNDKEPGKIIEKIIK